MTNFSYTHSKYPLLRMRRLRAHGWIRELVAENRLNIKDLIWPVFIIDGNNCSQEIASMPGVTRKSIDLTIESAKKAYDSGITSLALFPITQKEAKTEDGRESCNTGNLMCRALEAIKSKVPNIGLIADVALDPYTTHGHDGVIKEGRILNDETIEILCEQAIIQAQAGADIIAPSDMMDGRIGAIRNALDQKKLQDKIILSYAAKYASGFYGPFRDAVQSAGCLTGDKKTYQMNPANAKEALREVAMDLDEGADMIMVKPGLPYLDIIRNVKDTFQVPTFAYQVSGEYSMIRAACDKGWLNYEATILETMLSFKRAGADGILTYAALDIAELIAK